MKKLKLFVLLLIYALHLPAQGVQQKIDALVNAYVKDNKFNGSLLVAYKGKPIYEKGFGFKNVEARTFNDAQSIYQVGSLTKQFTSAVIMQLQEEKKLSIHDPLSKYFTGFQNGDKISIEHLLTHTSGLFNYTDDSLVMKNDVTRHYSQEQMLDLFKKYPPDFEPGSAWNYSNTGYLMLGYIIEKVTGHSYEEEVRKRILQPLGMTHSGFDFTNLKDTAKTKGYFGINGSTALVAPIVDSTIAFSAGALYSTVGDFHKWENAISTNKLLKPASWKAIFTPFKNKYGFGWGIDTLYGKFYTSHSGGIHGFSSYIIRFPNDQVSVIMMDNTMSSTLSKIAKAVSAILLNKPYELPEEKKIIAMDVPALKQYVGEYQLAPSFSVVVTLVGDGLKAQATGQQSFDLYPQKENVFFLKLVDAQLEFIKDDKGVVKELILHQNGNDIKGQRSQRSWK